MTEFQHQFTSKERRSLLRGAAVASVLTIAHTQTQSVEAQTASCITGINIVDAYSGKFEAAQVPSPILQPGNRTSISEVAIGNGQSPVRINIQSEKAKIVTLRDGRRGISNVEIYHHDDARYIRKDDKEPLQLELPCDVYVNLRMNRQQLPAGATPIATATTGVEIPTPTATARVETPTPTVTPVIHTPTPTHTPFVVTATPTPETPTPIIITATPTETKTMSGTPPYINRSFWESIRCIIPFSIAALAASTVYALRRD